MPLVVVLDEGSWQEVGPETRVYSVTPEALAEARQTGQTPAVGGGPVKGFRLLGLIELLERVAADVPK